MDKAKDERLRRPDVLQWRSELRRGLYVVVRVKEIRRSVEELGLSHSPLCLHSSLRSFGYVKGGATTVITGLVEQGCTVLVPSFSYQLFAVNPSPCPHLPRNGWGTGAPSGARAGANRIYSSSIDDIDKKEMGEIPAALLGMPNRVRGNHPLCSFSAVGPLAQRLVSVQTPTDVLAPLRELAELNGYVLLAGVGLEKMTLLHLAEEQAGRNLFRRWANNAEGKPMMVAVGGCSKGFPRLKATVGEYASTRVVGESIWQVYPALETLAAATEAIRQDPEVTHCGDRQCERCEDAVQGGPILTS